MLRPSCCCTACSKIGDGIVFVINQSINRKCEGDGCADGEEAFFSDTHLIFGELELDLEQGRKGNAAREQPADIHPRPQERSLRSARSHSPDRLGVHLVPGQAEKAKPPGRWIRRDGPIMYEKKENKIMSD